MRELESVANGQLLLPFDFYEEEKRVDVTKIPHIAAPQTDNERLLEYQYQYRVNGDQSALSAMYTLGIEVCERIIAQTSARYENVKALRRYERHEKAIDATTYVIEKLMREPQWYIADNFVAYLYLRVLHELFYCRKVDKIVSFVDLDELKGIIYDE